MSESRNRTLWLLRVGFAMCFVGHGVFGLLQKRDWLPFFNTFGISESAALTLMPVVGSVDILIGVAALVWPVRALFLYGAAWTVFTAALRPLVGLSTGEFFERAGNFGVPIALVFLTTGLGWFERVKTIELSPVRRASLLKICLWTTGTLLAGHGWLMLIGKPLLGQHLSLVGLSASAMPIVGGFELLLAAACVVRPNVSLLAGVVVWKVASESLFVAAGSPIWEFIERGGSYVAPLVGALLALGALRAMPARRLARAAAVAVGVSALSVATLAQTSGQTTAPTVPAGTPPAIDAALVAEMRSGGFVVTCRHSITSHSTEDRQPVDFSDPSTQRVLTPEGEALSVAIGKDLAALRIPVGEVLASPFDRTKRSAQLMFGRVTINEALSSMARGKDQELRALMTGPVAAGSNRFLLTHQGLIYRVFKSVSMGSVAEGDCLVVRPSAAGGDIRAQVKPKDWTKAGF